MTMSKQHDHGATRHDADGAADEVLFEVHDGVATITLNRPRVHNAMNDPLRAALAERFREIGERSDVRAALVRGAGPSFCSGRDTTRFVEPGEGSSHAEMIVSAQIVRLRQLGCGKPMIAALHGHAIGAGAELALGCDFRIAARDLRFSLPEAALGVVADTGSSTMLTALAGPARAKWLLLSGLPIGADEALSWGLVEWVVEREELDARARQLAETLARRPPDAVRRQKQLVDGQFFESIRAGMGREMFAQLEILEGEEYDRIRREREAARGAR